MITDRPPDTLDPKRWWILALCGLGQLMVVLDLTVVNIALPKAQIALHFSNDDRQWVITAYTSPWRPAAARWPAVRPHRA